MPPKAHGTVFFAALNALGALARPSSGVELDFGKNTSCCSILSQQLPGKVVVPGTFGYNTSAIEPYWSAQATDIVPACTVLPASTEEVSTVIRLLSAAALHGQDDASCNFAIRSGGHTPIAGAANIAGGVTINLVNLDMVEPSEDRSIVSVGPGNRWEDVYTKLDPIGLTVVGGRSRTVGVGGLVLSGGMSFFSPRRGIPSANVANYEIVLASGEVINADNTSHPDLHKALQGGLNNFGIVTRLDLRALEQGKFWGGVAEWDISALPVLFDCFEVFATSASYDEYSQFTLLYAWAPGRELAMGHMHYTQPSAAIPAPFHPIIDAVPPLSNSFRVDSLTNFTVELQSLYEGELQRLFATATYQASAAMHRRFYDLAAATAGKLVNETGVEELFFIVSAQPFNQVIISKTQENGGGSFQGLDAEDGDLMIFALTLEWASAADNEAVSAAVETLIKDAEKAARELGVFNEYIFPNYAAEWQDPIEGYGKENRARMREIAGRYDPSQLFQKAVPGGFKV